MKGVERRGGRILVSAAVAAESLPLQDAFAVLFFVSVGMLFDPRILLQNPWPMLATVVIVVVFRSIVSVVLLRLLGQTTAVSLSVAARTVTSNGDP